MRDQHIFKIVALCHDNELYENLMEVFGIEFESSYTSTSGAAFAYSHFNVDDQRLTGQFWMLDPASQWGSIRNLYIKGSSGIVFLLDAAKKNSVAINHRLLREFVSTNRFDVPIIVVNLNEKKSSEAKKFAQSIERWAGYSVPSVGLSTDLTSEFSEFFRNVRDWRAKNVIFQTLKLYFAIDAIEHENREIGRIVRQLRKIYTSHYYELLPDEIISVIVQQAAIQEGYKINSDKKTIEYHKKTLANPWEESEKKLQGEKISKPKVEKMD